jgi:2',3'-cyclic-nucleotide 2'-phosphodiesterase (5'-nucleotidase family)
MIIIKPGKTLLLCLFLLFIYTSVAQNGNKFTYRYKAILLDSTYDSNADPAMKAYIDSLQKKLSIEMEVGIGTATSELSSFAPASPLSNFLTDELFNFGTEYCKTKERCRADFSLLNFGGIRDNIPTGEITVGTIYKVLPFENNVVIIYLKGSEVKKIFNNFTAKDNQPYSQVFITYQNEKPFQVLINKEKIDDERIYRMVTVDFIATGGDRILENIHYEKVIYTNILIRDAIISQIRKISTSGNKIEAKTDERAKIEFQN